MLIDNWVSVSYPEISRLRYEFATKKKLKLSIPWFDMCVNNKHTEIIYKICIKKSGARSTNMMRLYILYSNPFDFRWGEDPLTDPPALMIFCYCFCFTPIIFSITYSNWDWNKLYQPLCQNWLDLTSELLLYSGLLGHSLIFFIRSKIHLRW